MASFSAERYLWIDQFPVNTHGRVVDCMGPVLVCLRSLVGAPLCTTRVIFFEDLVPSAVLLSRRNTLDGRVERDVSLLAVAPSRLWHTTGWISGFSQVSTVISGTCGIGMPAAFRFCDRENRLPEERNV